MIVGLALLEGSAFMALLAYLLEGQTWVLGLAAGVLALMAVRFPTRASVLAWLERQADALAALRDSPPA